MPVVFKRKLVKIGNSYRLTVPMELVEGQGWKEGEELTLTVTDGQILMSRENPPRGNRPVKR